MWSDRSWLFFLNPCLFWLKLCLMPFVYEVSKCCSGIFVIGADLPLKYYKKFRKMDQGCPRGSTSVQGGTPKRFRRTGRKNKAFPHDNFKHMASMWKPEIWKFGVFGVILVGECLLIHCSAVLGSSYIFFLWLAMNGSNIILKPNDLCTCTRRPHGSMSFEVSPSRILIISL